MIRLSSIFSIMLIACCATEQYAHSTEQDKMLRTIEVTFVNACVYPVQLTVFHYYGPVPPTVVHIKKVNLNANGLWSVVVFRGSLVSDNEFDAIPDDYRLEISANDKTITLNKTQFLAVLKKGEYFEKKYTSDRTYNFYGKINDLSLCP